MSLIIKGYIDRTIYEKDNYRIYSFLPNNEYIDKLILSEYGNISIKGELPSLIYGKEYEMEVEYEKKGKYENYVVKRILNNPMEMNERESYNFLSELVGKKTAGNILKVYPNFIRMIIKDKIDEIDINKIHGVGKVKFEYIVNKIKDNVMFFNIINEYHDYNLTLNQVRKMYEAFTSFELIKEKMEKNPYQCLCSIAGIGFKTADNKILNKHRDLITSSFRMVECILYVLKLNEEKGNTWIDINELYTKCSKITPECIKIFKNILENNKQIYYNSDSKKVAKMQTYYYEKEVAERLKTIMNNPRILDIDYSKYNSIDGCQLTDKQRLSIEYACSYNFYVLAGNAGTGKSYSSKALINMLDDNGFSYILLAPTGKAAKNLSLYTKRPASTIHRGLKFHPKEGFFYNENNKLPYDFIIVDEAGMIDVFLMRNLLKSIDENTSKLIFICDPAQLPSVGCGNCIQDIINSGVVPIITLDKVFRYEEGGLAKIATETRKGKNFLIGEGIQKFGDDFVFVPANKENILQKVLLAYKKMEEKGGTIDDIVILSAYNKGEWGTYNINSIIQDYVNPPLDNEEVSYVKNNYQITFRVNDRVLQIENNYRAARYDIDVGVTDGETSVFNGDDGRIVKIGTTHDGVKYIVVKFDEDYVYYKGDEIKSLLLAYSMSAHRSQGSGFPYVIAVTPPSHKFFLNRNLLYVMYTRTKKFIYNIGTADTIQSALRKSENLLRQTFLKEMLICNNDNYNNNYSNNEIKNSKIIE